MWCGSGFHDLHPTQQLRTYGDGGDVCYIFFLLLCSSKFCLNPLETVHDDYNEKKKSFNYPIFFSNNGEPVIFFFCNKRLTT